MLVVPVVAATVAPRTVTPYFNEMIGRPCKPDDDLKGLWRLLLGTPFPACGMPEETDVAGNESAGSGRGENPGVELDAKTAAAGE